MSTTKRLFKVAVFALLGAAGSLSAFAGQTAEVSEIKENQTGLYQNVFDQLAFYEGTAYLRFDRLGRLISRKKLRAQNVNLFDEVPDSAFFTNRHFRKPLSAEELEEGYHENEGPDLNGTLKITKAKFTGSSPSLRVKDSRGDEYLLKFDPADNIELGTAAGVIANRIYHAIGYNVPQDTIAVFASSQLVPAENADVIDNTGFTRPLTKEKLEEFLLFLPWNSDGKFQAVASKILSGEDKGFMPYTGRRKNDPADVLSHEKRREIRAIQVVSSWLNNYDIRDQNTKDILEKGDDGKPFIKHYFLDFNSSLGSDRNGAKPPHFGYEYMSDGGEVFKAILGLGFWEKPWEKKWREAQYKVLDSPALGYFDNRRFNPGKYKTHLPFYAFKDLTRADGFWAAKIIMSFSDEDIKAIVKAGQFTNPDDAEYIVKTLIERRDIIGKYWFFHSSALDAFDVKGNKLVFEDLALKYGLEKEQDTSYLFEIRDGRGKKLASLEIHEPSLRLEPSWLSLDEGFKVKIRTKRGAESKANPYVLVELRKTGVTGIQHQD